MKFLIDECFHTTLIDVARDRGRFLGLSGDWRLMPRIVAEDYTFVTNTARFESYMPGKLVSRACLSLLEA